MRQNFTTPYPHETLKKSRSNYLASFPNEKMLNICATCIWNTVYTCASTLVDLYQLLTTVFRWDGIPREELYEEVLYCVYNQ